MSNNSVRLIVGLGNPGAEYAASWHNLGFRALDAWREAESYRFGEWTAGNRGTVLIAASLLPQSRISLAKPQTFMNASGPAVAELMRGNRIRPEELWVIHDDLDLPVGKLRISRNATAGGHRGAQSIMDAIGTANFTRIRLGIDTPERQDVAAETYVLQAIPSTAETAVNEMVERTLQALEVAQLAGVTEAMNQFN